jgi:hypothetical protein
MGVKHNLLAWGLALFQGLALAQVPAPAALAASAVLADDIYEQAADAMFWSDWAELERLSVAARSDTQRGREGGLAVCRFVYGMNRGYGDESLPYHEARVASTLEWARRRPDLPLAHAAHLNALVSLAWFHRGGGYANTVSDQRFADFRAKLNEALAYTKANSTVMSRDTSYVAPLLTLMRGLNVDADRQLEVVRKSLRKDAADECLYRSAITSLLPKWGGDPRRLDAWVHEAMRGQPEAVALTRYARLYDEATTGEYEQGVFENSLARWPLMRDGLRAILAESPDSKTWKNRLAYFACMVKDRDVAVPALEAIDAAPEFEDWGPTGHRTYQACRRWALQS